VVRLSYVQMKYPTVPPVGQWWDNGGTMVGQWWDNGGTMRRIFVRLYSVRTVFAPPFGGTMVGQWWDNGGTMVGQWWDNGGTMVGQWWDNGGQIRANFAIAM